MAADIFQAFEQAWQTYELHEVFTGGLHRREPQAEQAKVKPYAVIRRLKRGRTFETNKSELRDTDLELDIIATSSGAIEELILAVNILHRKTLNIDNVDTLIMYITEDTIEEEDNAWHGLVQIVVKTSQDK